MHAEEPSLLDHLRQCRARVSEAGKAGEGQAGEEGGLSFVVFAGTMRHEADMTEALSAHRKVSEGVRV